MYHHIMAPLDGSELAECVLPHVQAIARGCNVGRVTLVRAVEPFHLYEGLETGISPEERKRLESDSMDVARRYLEKVVKRLKSDGIMAQPEVLFGKVVEEIVDYATNNGVDLVVVATHGRSGVSRWVMGSTASRILRSSCVPVLMVRAPGCVPGI